MSTAPDKTTANPQPAGSLALDSIEAVARGICAAWRADFKVNRNFTAIDESMMREVMKYAYELGLQENVNRPHDQ